MNVILGVHTINRLLINIEKTNCISFITKNVNDQLSSNNNTETMILGYHPQKMSWKTHIELLFNNLSKSYLYLVNFKILFLSTYLCWSTIIYYSHICHMAWYSGEVLVILTKYLNYRKNNNMPEHHVRNYLMNLSF